MNRGGWDFPVDKLVESEDIGSIEKEDGCREKKKKRVSRLYLFWLVDFKARRFLIQLRAARAARAAKSS